MPLYEYRCSKCGHKFELLRGMSRADEPATCSCCGHEEAKRLVSTFASFSKSASGAVQSVGGGSGCSSCAGSSCATCH